MSRLRVIVILGLVAVLTVSSITLNLMMGTDLFGFSLAALLFAVVGTFLLIKVPHNPVGMLLAIGGTAWLLYTSAGEYGRLSLQSESGAFPGEYLAGWIGSWLGALLPASLAALLLVFPDGRPPRGWRWLAVALVMLAVTAVVGAVLLWELPITVLTDFDALDREPRYQWVDLVFVGGFAAVLPATASLVMRYRRGDRVQRQQIKWLLAAAVSFASVFVIGNVLFTDVGPIWEGMVSLSMALVPVAVAFAVARYRLYEIDRLLARTVSYA
ncbi:MAG: hypothetical protein ACRDVL_11745, partial [Acidimicrobiia bacterium]